MTPFDPAEIRAELVRRRDNLLSWIVLNRKERRRQGVLASREDLERMLLATELLLFEADSK